MPIELVEVPKAKHAERARRWPYVVALAVLLLAVVALILLIVNWPFTRQAVIDALQESSARTVTIERFKMTFFPPGCVAEGIDFLHRKHKDKPPLITIQKLVIKGSYLGLIGSPKRLSKVVVVGMHVTVPPNSNDGKPNPVMPLTDASTNRPIEIGRILADGAILEFVSSHPNKEPFKLIIDKLALDGVGKSKPIKYQATINNTEPVGVINSTGQFGPWNPDDPGVTAVAGTYSFEHADLATFKDLSGILSSQGNFSGTLARMAVQGKVGVSGFRVNHSAHAVNLTSEYQGSVNATDGDTFLESVKATLAHTILDASGAVTSIHGVKGKSVSLNVSSTNGRIEDLLNLFLEAKRSPMTGLVTLKAKIDVPPEPGAFLEKLSMVGDFGLTSSKFEGHDLQNSLDKLSMSARPDETKQEKEDPETVLSNFKGYVSAKNGIATLSRISFDMPGASALVNGTYNLITEQVDLHGVLRTDGKVYVSTTGFKSFLLRAISPLLKHKSRITFVPFKITGKYPNTTVSLDLFAKK